MPMHERAPFWGTGSELEPGCCTPHLRFTVTRLSNVRVLEHGWVVDILLSVCLLHKCSPSSHLGYSLVSWSMCCCPLAWLMLLLVTPRDSSPFDWKSRELTRPVYEDTAVYHAV